MHHLVSLFNSVPDNDNKKKIIIAGVFTILLVKNVEEIGGYTRMLCCRSEGPHQVGEMG